MPAAPNRARTPLRALAPAAFAIPILAAAPARKKRGRRKSA